MNGDADYWWELVEYDLETARAMLSTGRYLYVGFMCHSVIEKSLKAVISANGIMPPKTHNLSRLAVLAGLLDRMGPEHLAVLDVLEPMNIEGRYPGDVRRLSRALNADSAMHMLSQTEELCTWLRAG